MPRKERSKSKRKPKTRPPLTPERVLDAAVAFADENGVEALSMRELARELGFGVMSLYNHVANKDEMLDGMVERVAQEIEAPAPRDGDWKTAMRETAVSAHQVLLRHPWACAMWSKRGPGPAKLHHMESILRGLREAGFSAQTACRGYHAITMHIHGFTMQKLDFPFDDDELTEVATQFLAQLPTETYPYFAEHIRQHLDPSHQTDDFEFVLNLILDGLERIERQR